MLRISLVVLALVSCALAASKSCPGCIVELDANSPDAHQRLQLLLNAVHSNEVVTKIIRYAYQVVAGNKYYFTYETKSGKTCKGSYVSQSWVSPDPQGVENKCT